MIVFLSSGELITAINNDMAIAKVKLSSPEMEQFKSNNFFGCHCLDQQDASKL